MPCSVFWSLGSIFFWNPTVKIFSCQKILKKFQKIMQLFSINANQYPSLSTPNTHTFSSPSNILHFLHKNFLHFKFSFLFTILWHPPLKPEFLGQPWKMFCCVSLGSTLVIVRSRAMRWSSLICEKKIQNFFKKNYQKILVFFLCINTYQCWSLSTPNPHTFSSPCNIIHFLHKNFFTFIFHFYSPSYEIFHWSRRDVVNHG